MKNKYFKLSLSVFVAILFLTNCDAQKSEKIRGDGNVVNESRDVGSFDELSVSGSFDVDLVSGKEGKMEIKIEKNLIPYLVTEVENGQLKIKWKKGTNINTSKGVHLTVYFNSLNGVAISGSGDIISKDVIKTDSFSAAVSGSGDMNLNIETRDLEVRVSGSGDLEFNGSADKFSAAVSGSGGIDAFGLKAVDCDLKVSGSGGIRIDVSGKLYARVSGSGSVKYTGNPEVEDTKVSGSGRISSAN